MFYQLYKYLFLYAYQQPTTTDTGGLFYPKALQHVFVGLYVEQICLCALFFLAQDTDRHPSAIPEGALMVVLIVLTVSISFGFGHVMSSIDGDCNRLDSTLSSIIPMVLFSLLYH